MYMLLNLYGHLMISLALVLLESRFLKIGMIKLNIFLMCQSVIEFFMSYEGLGKLSSLTQELKRRAYCKLHNIFSHATNDCNVLRRQIQSAINEGRLVVPAMQIDQNPFPVHTLELSNPKVLIRPHQAESTKQKKCGGW